MLAVLILDGLRKIGRQRSISGLMHIFYGKRNHQSWTDLHLFGLLPQYRFLHGEEKDLFERELGLLADQNWIQCNGNHCSVSVRTDEILKEYREQLARVGERDGRVVHIMERYWNHLHLLTQTLSFLIQKQRFSHPVVHDEEIQIWVKSWLYRHGLKKGALGLHQELKMLLSQFSSFQQQMALLRLTGVHRTALTVRQLAQEFGQSYWQVKWDWETFLTQLFYKLQENRYLYLPPVVPEHVYFTQSCLETRKLLEQGLAVEQIARIRGLKPATILDHIVEIALVDPSFRTEAYLPASDLKRIQAWLKENPVFKLSRIKEAFPNLTYFQIRLALAVIANEHQSPFGSHPVPSVRI